MEVVLHVNHETRARWHTFTSNDMPGLFVTGEGDDLSALVESLPATIAALFKARTGKVADVHRLGHDAYGSPEPMRAGSQPVPAPELMQFLVITSDGR